jgi:hypothetical protein
MSAQDIYDFEVIVPVAVQTVLTAAGLTAMTIADTQDFQKTRPRVEVVYKHTGEAQPQRKAMLDDGSKRTSCFRGELKLHAITDADAAGKLAHSEYRAQVRAAVAVLQDQLNGSALANHNIQFITSGNEETGVRSADGYQQTTFSFQVDLSVQQDAWSIL